MKKNLPAHKAYCDAATLYNKVKAYSETYCYAIS